MFSTIKSSKIARLAGTSAVLGTAAVMLFLGAPAEAAIFGRGI